MTEHHRASIAVIGASLGGVLAAWRAAQAGCRVLLLAEQRWLGGQMTAQAVPPDEHELIELGGASASYLGFRAALRAAYRAEPGFVDRSTMTEGCNPGDGWVSRLCIEPARAAAWFEALLAAEVGAGRLQLLRLPAAAWLGAEVAGGSLRALSLRDARGVEHRIEAPWWIDATDSGELLAAAAVPWRVGKEAADEFGEPDAPAVADPLDQQPITHVFALRRAGAAARLGDPPPGYDFWRERVLPHHAHRVFSDAMPGHERGSSARLPFEADGAALDWWRYRRIVSAAQWQPPRADVTLVNWPQNDFNLLPLIDGPRPQHEVLAQARAQSECLLHWLRSEAPRPDGGRGFANWQLAADMLGSDDGFAQQAYLRESRRIVARDTLTQRTLQRAAQGHAASVGIGWYRLDIHPTCVSGHGTNAEVLPFELPLGAFIPAAGGNVVPGCKNIGMTHLAGGAARVHPVEWLIGEVAGLLAAQALHEGWPDTPAQQARLFTALEHAGVPRHWSPALLARRGSGFA